MRNVYDPSGSRELLKLLQAAEDHCNEIWSQLKTNSEISQVRTVCDVSCLMDEYESRLYANKKRLEGLIAAMKTHFEQLDRAQEKGNAFQADGVDWETVGLLGGTAAAAGYAGYASWEFLSSGRSLSGDYNDLDGFLNTSAYRSAWEKAGLGEWANTELYIQAGAGLLDSLFGTELSGLMPDYWDEYADELLENALSGILESLPDAELRWEFTGLSDTVSNLTGVENLDKWADQLASLIKKCAEDGMTSEEILNSADVWQMLQQLSPDENQVFCKMFKKVYEANKLSETVSDVLGAAGIIDDCIEVLTHCLNDYSGQVAYLEAMENGILAAGFSGGPVIEKIEEMKKIYQSDFLKAMDVLEDYVKDEAISAGKGAVLKAVSKKIPFVKDVDFGLKVVDTAADILFADEIGAVKGLNGLRQYDHVLTKSYERYEEMIRAGTATDADMREADRLFQILKATKIKEYEHMMILCEDSDYTSYEYYKAKKGQLEAA